MAELQNTLPPGWDRQLDKKSGRYYYINHYTKTTSWEDPRHNKHRHPTGSSSVTTDNVYIPLQDLSNLSRSSPRTVRVQDSSLSASTSNTEEAVAKISAMFPTVSDTHIRILLKKYMKSIFPKADETMILDILSNNDNNIQKASELLKEMGYEKRDSAKLSRHQHTPKLYRPKEQPAEAAASVVAPKAKTLEDKKLIKAQLQEKYTDIPEQVIMIALESVDYDKDRAIQILQIMVQEENDKQTSPKPSDNQDEITVVEDSASLPVSVVPSSQSRQSLKSLLKTEKSNYSLKNTDIFSRVFEEQSDFVDDMGYRSQNLTNTNGANRTLVKGANHDLLLEDYIKWQGPQPISHQGSQRELAKGPNSALLSVRTYKPCGPNPELRKGPKFSSAKGSILSQLKDAVVGESRGK